MNSSDAKNFGRVMQTENREETDGKECDNTKCLSDTILEKRQEAVISVDRHSFEYNMSHKSRGKAVIFNHMKFTNGLDTRYGTEVDEARLKDCFNSLGFEVKVYHDLKLIELFTVLHELRKEDHSNRDCLVVVVLSHGEHDKIFCKDSEYQSEDLWSLFTADKCTSLAGKPKIFFIQACRGKKLDSGTKYSFEHCATLARMQTENRPIIKCSPDNNPYVIPNRADFLFVFSSSLGYVSYRHTHEGSWFIQTLTKVLSEKKGKKDLLSMMTILARYVAVNFTTDDPDEDKKKQIPSINSTLTREIWF